MRITKKNLKLGMKFMIKDKLSCLRYSFDEYGHLKMGINDYGDLECDMPVTVAGLNKKYRLSTGYSGDMVKFEVEGQEFVAFWINFKKSTNYLEDEIEN